MPAAGTYACLEVADDGCGIPAKDLDKIFDPFYRTKFTGRGMGLAILLGVLRSSDGCCQVNSVPGKGSFFSIYLPITGA